MSVQSNNIVSYKKLKVFIRNLRLNKKIKKDKVIFSAEDNSQEYVHYVLFVFVKKSVDITLNINPNEKEGFFVHLHSKAEKNNKFSIKYEKFIYPI